MNTSTATSLRRSDWFVPVGLILLSVVPAVAGTARLASLASGAAVTEANAQFFAAPVAVVVHILSVIPFSIPGALQCSRGFPWPTGDGVAVYVLRLVFGSAMFVSIVRAADAIRRRDFRSHGAWMTRSYAIGLGAGTQVLTHLAWLGSGSW
ncbi:MAG: Protein of unknown function rane [Gemmatimonadetes bacterium]|nr:Protein of unknown function rane [Gemmatimonadota bacterium]